MLCGPQKREPEIACPTGHARQLCPPSGRDNRHPETHSGHLPRLGLVPTLQTNFGNVLPIKNNIDRCVLADCDLDGNRFVWVGLWHPTRFWSTINQRYFKETAVPAITVARKRALKLAQTV